MALLYSVKRDNRQDSKHLYYGRACIVNTVDTAMLAALIESKCTLTKTDIKAVIDALVDQMTFLLQNSNAVKLNGFGTFKIGIKTVGAESAHDFTVTDNIKGFRLNFLPEGHKDVGSGKMTRTFLDGCTVKKYGE